MRHDLNLSRDNIRSLKRSARAPPKEARHSTPAYRSQFAAIHDLSIDAPSVDALLDQHSAVGLDGDRKAIRLYTRQHKSMPGFFTIQNLPPTPPSRSFDNLDGAPDHSRSFTAPESTTQKLNDARALTPNPSPHLGQPQDAPRQASACSDYAETFVTADEARSVANHTPMLPWSEDEDEDNELSSDDACDNDPATPTRCVTAMSHQSNTSLISSPEDPVLSPNVTVRKVRPNRDVSTLRRSAHESELRARALSDSHYLSAEEGSPRPTSRHRLLDASTDDNATVDITDDLYTRLRDEKAKRLSGVSITSTVVSAVVHSNPAKPQGKLRRAKKTQTLRSSDSSPRSQQADTSSPGSTIPRLKHRSSTTGMRDAAKRDSCYSDNVVSSVSELPSPDAADSSPEPSPVKCDNDISAAAAAKKSLRHKQRHRSLSDKAASDSPDPEQIQGEHQQQSIRDSPILSRSSSPRLSDTLAVESSQSPPVSDTAQEAAKTPERGTSPSPQSHVRIATPPAPHASSPAQRTVPVADLQESESRFEPAQASTHLAVPWSKRGSLETRPAGLLPSAILSPSEAPRSPLSPAQSQFSDRIETLEVNQATAVNILSHKTHSVLVVDQCTQPSRTTNLAGGETARRVSSDAKRITVTRKPVSRSNSNLPVDTRDRLTSKYNSVHLSPSRPNTPPKDGQPPEITLCPATPSSNIDPPAEAVGHLRPASPARRRDSVKERARYYSTLLTQPIMGRSGSVRSINHERPTGMRRFSSRHLHPEWRPRHSFLSFDDGELPFRRRELNSGSLKHRFRRSMSHRLSLFGRGVENIMFGARDPSVEEVYRGHISVHRSLSSHSLPAADVPPDNDIGDVYNGHRHSRISQSSHALPSSTQLIKDPVSAAPRATRGDSASLSQPQSTIRASLEKDLPPLPPLNDTPRQHAGVQPSLRRRNSRRGLRQPNTGFEVLNRYRQQDSGFEVLNRPARQGTAPVMTRRGSSRGSRLEARPDGRTNGARFEVARHASTHARKPEARIHKIPGLDYGIQIEGLSSLKNRLRGLQRSYSTR